MKYTCSRDSRAKGIILQKYLLELPFRKTKSTVKKDIFATWLNSNVQKIPDRIYVWQYFREITFMTWIAVPKRICMLACSNSKTFCYEYFYEYLARNSTSKLFLEREFPFQKHTRRDFRCQKLQKNTRRDFRCLISRRICRWWRLDVIIDMGYRSRRHV